MVQRIGLGAAVVREGAVPMDRSQGQVAVRAADDVDVFVALNRAIRVRPAVPLRMVAMSVRRVSVVV